MTVNEVNKMMAGMRQQNMTVNGVRLNVRVGGSGKPLVLLHGAPQSSIMWRKIVPALIDNYTLVCPDLRGYGDSQKTVKGYDKRTMALDIKLLMERLGFQRYGVIGHDRGGRVAHRLALDHPDSVENLCLLDIVPTHTLFNETNKELAVAYWHWYFFQIPDLPEKLLNSDPDWVFHSFMNSLTYHIGSIEQDAMEQYKQAFKSPGAIRALLEDYRAASTIDYAHDEEDLNKKITCPLLVLWGEYGKMHELFNVLDTWKEKATNVTGTSLPAGHFVAEESPGELLEELREFYRRIDY